MALPASLTNGQVSTVNGVSYIYDSATNSLTRTSSGTLSLNSANISTSTTTGALTVAGGAGIAGNVFAGNVLASGFFYANGTPFVSSSYGNTDVASYLPTYSGSIGAASEIVTLTANAGAQANQITGANAAIVTANTALKAYTDGQITTTQSWVTGANAAIITANTALKAYTDNQISTANTALKSYVDTQDSAVTSAWTANALAQHNSIIGANAAIITANTALKSYVDTQDSTITTAWTSNAGAQANQITGANAAIVSANTALKAYTDAQITTTQSWVTGANAATVTANTALKGYVDQQFTNLTNGAPAILDTLGEIATSLGNNASLSTTLLNSIAGSNAAIVTANTALKAYTDGQITVTQSWVTGANAAIIIANTALKSYVDTQDSAITTAWTSNAGAQANQITGANAVVATLQANVGSFYTYANATFIYGNVQMLANLAATGNPVTIGSNLTVTNAVTAANVYSTGVYIGSGSATSGLFWSANSSAVSTGGGITYTASTSPPDYPTIGDQWYNTSTDVLYEYINDGTSLYWVDTISTVVSSGATGATGTIANTASWIVTTNTTAATSTTTGALQVAGGAGIAGNVYAGNVYSSGNVVAITYFVGNGSQLTGISSAISWTITSSNITVSKNNGYFVDTTTGPKTLTLPTSATIGDTVRINDLAGTFASNNLTVGANGGKIQGANDDLLINVNQQSFGLVYSNSTYGWKVIEL